MSTAHERYGRQTDDRQICDSKDPNVTQTRSGKNRFHFLPGLCPGPGEGAYDPTFDLLVDSGSDAFPILTQSTTSASHLDASVHIYLSCTKS